MNYEKFNDYIWRAIRHGTKKISLDECNSVVEPLVWYVQTGRASYDFMVALAEKAPWRVFDVLKKNSGCTEDALLALKRYLGVI